MRVARAADNRRVTKLAANRKFARPFVGYAAKRLIGTKSSPFRLDFVIAASSLFSLGPTRRGNMLHSCFEGLDSFDSLTHSIVNSVTDLTFNQ